jgi:hypothetical protein
MESLPGVDAVYGTFWENGYDACRWHVTPGWRKANFMGNVQSAGGGESVLKPLF